MRLAFAICADKADDGGTDRSSWIGADRIAPSEDAVQSAARQVGGQCAVGQRRHLLFDVDKPGTRLGQQRHELLDRHAEVDHKHVGDLRRLRSGELRISRYGHRRLSRGKDEPVAISDLSTCGQQRQRTGQGVDTVGRGVEALKLQQPASAQ